MNDWSDEETDDAHYADDRNFYKVELWTKDTQRISANAVCWEQSRQGAHHLHRFRLRLR
jgi:hypothetical protein